MSARRALLPLLLAAGWAQADDFVLQRVLVEGARASQLGVADAASAGTIAQRELAGLVAYRPGELLEAIPGVVVTQHSGEGKANQFYLRGFNLDHGTDLRTTLDDMPVNQRSHSHGQGWTDLNFVIPELTARIDYGKGPYAAPAGDFASAGSAAIVYANRLPRSVASLSAGQDGYARAVVAASTDAGEGTLLYALEAVHNDGPFAHPDDYRKLNAVLRYSLGFANNGLSISAMAYDGRWNATDQIPARAVNADGMSRFGAIDPTDGGDAHRYSLSAVWRRTASDTADKVSLYLIRNQLHLFSNFTYFLDDPVNGDQIGQPDRRVTSGANASRTWHTHGETTNNLYTVGVQLQNDNIVNGLLATRGRATLAVQRQDHIVEGSVGVYAEAHTIWREWLRTSAGLRADSYRFRVDGAQRSDTQLSPSAGVVLGPWQATELYLNAGSGFHSNDARGVLAGAAGLVRSRGIEAGVRSEAFAKLQLSAALYRLDVDSELTYQGDEGTTEAGAPSRRTGIELSAYYKPTRWLTVEADAAYARARARVAGADRIPEAIEGVAQFGVSAERGPWSAALRARYFGPRPLTEDNRVRSHASTTFNGRLAYRIDPTTRIELEAFNLANRGASAVDYFYRSRLAGEPQAHDDVHFHPLEPRTLRLTLVRNF